MRDDWEDMVSDNTVPLALIGVGLGWLVLSTARSTGMFEQAQDWTERQRAMSRGRRARLRGQFHGAQADHRGAMSRYYDEARGRVSSAMASVRRGAEELRHRAGEQMQRMRGQSGHDTAEGYDSVADHDARADYAAYGEGSSSYDHAGAAAGRGQGPGGIMNRSRGMMQAVSSRTRNANDSLWDMIDEHPIAAGLMGIALGAALGASLPATRAEDEWFGEYRDRLADQAWREGEDYMERATNVAREAISAGAEAARERAADEADRQGLTSDQPNI